MNSLAKRFTWGGEGLVIRGNYVWCLAIVTKFKGLGGANRWGEGGLKSSYGDSKPQRGVGLK